MGRRNVLFSLAICTTLFAGGCCCACNPGAFVRAVQTNAKNAAAKAAQEAEESGGSSDEDYPAGRQYAQQALNNLGYGEIQSARLTKGENAWSVSGVAGGKEGGDVNYDVLFSVLRNESEGEIRLRWNVQSVTVNGEVVYP